MHLLPIPLSTHIVELNDSSFIISTPEGKVLVYTENCAHYNLLDTIHLSEITPFEPMLTTYGFNQEMYIKTNNLIGYSDEESVQAHYPNPMMNFIGLGGFNADPVFQKLSRAVLFQTDPTMSFISLISLGLIYTMILKTGTTLFSFFVGEKAATWVMLVTLSLVAWWFAYPLSLVRVVVSAMLSLCIKKPSHRLIIYILFFMVFQRSSLQSITILYPLILLFFSVFKINKSTQYTSLGFVQIGLFHRVSLLFIYLYPFLRKLMAILIFLIWLGYGFPWLNTIISLCYRVIQVICLSIESNLILKGALTYAVIGFFIGQLIIQSLLPKKLNLFFGFSILMIPILSSPWFYQVSLISVGQGDAILLQAPFNQEVILIDTGKASAYDQVSSFLDAQGITKIDRLILTHDDADHSGNHSKLVNAYQITETISAAQDLDLTWFHLKSLKTQLKDPTDNQASLVYLFQIDQCRFLLMADADEQTESDLIRNYPDLKADILKVGHHGSATSTSDILLSHIQAQLGIISVGTNSYGHPAQAVLDRLTAFHIPVLTTISQGDIIFIINQNINFLWTSLRKHRVLRLGI